MWPWWNPHANKLTVHILAAVAQHEREAAIVAVILHRLNTTTPLQHNRFPR